MLRWIKEHWFRWRALGWNARTGAKGEKLAGQFLKRKAGFKIVACNWRSPRDRRDEIDLVCRDGDVLVFVEVKTRSPDALVSGYHAVDRAKKRVLLRACQDYLMMLGKNERPRTFRFDVVEVERGRDEATVEIRHFENVPLFPKELCT